MRIAYLRCNGGHYFIGLHCPLEGWSSSEAGELVEVTRRLAAGNQPISVDALSAAGLSDRALRRTMVIEFGDERSAFEAIVPEGYVVGGHWKKLCDCDEHHS